MALWNRIINIHSSLLFLFPVILSQKNALKYGVIITGYTAHFIDEGMDIGPIIMQTADLVQENDTEESLSLRIMHDEYNIIAESVKYFCENRLDVFENKVVLRRQPEDVCH